MTVSFSTEQRNAIDNAYRRMWTLCSPGGSMMSDAKYDRPYVKELAKCFPSVNVQPSSNIFFAMDTIFDTFSPALKKHFYFEMWQDWELDSHKCRIIDETNPIDDDSDCDSLCEEDERYDIEDFTTHLNILSTLCFKEDFVTDAEEMDQYKSDAISFANDLNEKIIAWGKNDSPPII